MGSLRPRLPLALVIPSFKGEREAKIGAGLPVRSPRESPNCRGIEKAVEFEEYHGRSLFFPHALDPDHAVFQKVVAREKREETLIDF